MAIAPAELSAIESRSIWTAMRSGGLVQTKSTGADMNLSRNVSEIIREHVTLSVESIDRLYLNVYQPQLQRDLGVVGFFRHHRGQPFASSVLMAAMTRTFVASIES